MPKFQYFKTEEILIPTIRQDWTTIDKPDSSFLCSAPAGSCKTTHIIKSMDIDTVALTFLNSARTEILLRTYDMTVRTLCKQFEMFTKQLECKNLIIDEYGLISLTH